MKTKHIIKTILFWFTNLLVLLIAGHAFYVGIVSSNFTKELLGITMILTGGVGKIVQYLFTKKLTKDNSLLFMFGLLGVSFGFIFYFSELLSIEQICLFWGIYELCEGGAEIALEFLKKKNILFFVELVVSLLGILFGSLLCIHGVHGLKEHLIFVGSIYICNVLISVYEFFEEKYKEKRGKSNE